MAHASTNPLGFGSANLSVNLHESELALYREKARQAGVSLGEYARGLLLAALAPRDAMAVREFRRQMKSAMLLALFVASLFCAEQHDMRKAGRGTRNARVACMKAKREFEEAML